MKFIGGLAIKILKGSAPPSLDSPIILQEGRKTLEANWAAHRGGRISVDFVMGPAGEGWGRGGEGAARIYWCQRRQTALALTGDLFCRHNP